MPSYRRPQEKLQRSLAHDVDRDSYLLTGPVMPGWGFERLNGVEDTDAARAYWERHRERLMAKWISEHPGTRPRAWWAFEAPELRRRIDGKVHPFNNTVRSLYVAAIDLPVAWKRAYKVHWGIPSTFIPPFDNDLYADFVANGLDTKLFEAEWEYLVRHNLLLPEDSP